MYKFLYLFATFLFFNKSFASFKVSCKDFGLRHVFKTAYAFIGASTKKTDFDVKFKIETDIKKEALEINDPNWKLLRINFDPSKKTYLIIHGFMSTGNKSWVINLKNAILETVSI